MHYPVVIPRSMVRIRPVRVTPVAGWPSGLRRQFKALVSSEARVRISLQSLFDLLRSRIGIESIRSGLTVPFRYQ